MCKEKKAEQNEQRFSQIKPNHTKPNYLNIFYECEKICNEGISIEMMIKGIYWQQVIAEGIQLPPFYSSK